MRVLNWRESAQPLVDAAVHCLRQGRLVAFPTDTLYGLGADVTQDAAVRRLFQAKRRPPEAALPILVADIEQAVQLAAEVPELALRLGNHYWPGPLTIVFERAASFRSAALAGGDSVAIRVPDHPAPLALIRGLGAPLTGTSANRSGEPAPCTAAEVVEQVGEDVDIVIDGGPCSAGVESTVVDLRGGVPRLLREGAVTREELEAVAGVEFVVVGR